MMMRSVGKTLGLLLLLSYTAVAADTLSTSDAAKHIGESGTVCGAVVGVHTATSSKGSPTFVNLDKTYPNQVFTILIWGSDLHKFNPAPSGWNGKGVCVRGKIELYRNAAEIVAHEPGQITYPK